MLAIYLVGPVQSRYDDDKHYAMHSLEQHVKPQGFVATVNAQARIYSANSSISVGRMPKERTRSMTWPYQVCSVGGGRARIASSFESAIFDLI